jgi:DUF1365 family protein
MTAFTSKIYFGEVVHRRHTPHRHYLRYRVCYLLLDLDEVDALTLACKLLSRNRFNIFSFHDCDHGDGSSTPLRTQIEGHLAAAGIAPPGGPIRILTLPRILGYVFNPISTYFCYRHDGALAAILYEVTNTFRQRHFYATSICSQFEKTLRHEFPKALYVSPFLKMGMTYSFRVVPPNERLALSVTCSDDVRSILFTSLVGRRRPLNDGFLFRTLLLYLALTVKVTAGIHWEALRLWLKGIRVVQRPAPPEARVTASQQLPKLRRMDGEND